MYHKGQLFQNFIIDIQEKYLKFLSQAQPCMVARIHLRQVSIAPSDIIRSLEIIRLTFSEIMRKISLIVFIFKTELYNGQ